MPTTLWRRGFPKPLKTTLFFAREGERENYVGRKNWRKTAFDCVLDTLARFTRIRYFVFRPGRTLINDAVFVLARCKARHPTCCTLLDGGRVARVLIAATGGYHIFAARVRRPVSRPLFVGDLLSRVLRDDNACSDFGIYYADGSAGARSPLKAGGFEDGGVWRT